MRENFQCRQRVHCLLYTLPAANVIRAQTHTHTRRERKIRLHSSRTRSGTIEQRARKGERERARAYHLVWKLLSMLVPPACKGVYGGAVSFCFYVGKQQTKIERLLLFQCHGRHPAACALRYFFLNFIVECVVVCVHNPYTHVFHNL